MADGSFSQDRLSALTKEISLPLSRANKLGEELSRAIDGWRKSHGLTLESSIAKDRMSWELWADPNHPAVDEWGSLFSDGVHNIRRALDHLAWGLANLGAGQPTRPRRIQFPIVLKQEDWRTEQLRIAELPLRAQTAIESVQPFQRTGGDDGTPESDGLLLLNTLDNIAKHRISLQPLLNAQEISHEFSIEFRTEDEAALEDPPQVELFGDPLVSRALLMRQTTRSPIVKVKGSIQLKGQVVVTLDDGRSFGVTESLANLLGYTGIVIDLVLSSCSPEI